MGYEMISLFEGYFLMTVPIPAVCKAVSPPFPPAAKRALAVAPSIIAQKTLWIFGGSGSPLDVKQSITNEPESDEVTKYKTMANKLENEIRLVPLTHPCVHRCHGMFSEGVQTWMLKSF